MEIGKKVKFTITGKSGNHPLSPFREEEVEGTVFERNGEKAVEFYDPIAGKINWNYIRNLKIN